MSKSIKLSTLGSNILTLRKNKGMTQDELGNAVGTTGGTISNYERGTVSRPDHNLIVAIADFFNVDVKELYKEHNNVSEFIYRDYRDCEIENVRTIHRQYYENRVTFDGREYLIIVSKTRTDDGEPQYDTEILNKDGSELNDPRKERAIHFAWKAYTYKNFRNRNGSNGHRAHNNGSH